MIRMRMCLLLGMLLSAVPSFAQDATGPKQEPIGWFAADVRVAFPKFKGGAQLADELDVEPLDLPTHALGIVVGAHVYPLRKGAVTLGLGGELLKSAASRTKPPATEGGPDGPTVETHFSALSPQISLNFGSRDGWSYLSGGIGYGKLTTELQSKPLPDPDRSTKVINYGGGARWFAKPHLAVSLDLRFYAINPQEKTPQRPAYPRMTMLVLNAGIAVK